MAIQRPGRPTTRLGQPAVPPPKPAGRPSTGPVPKQSAPPPAAKGKSAASSTRTVQKQGSSRPVPKAAPKSNTTMLIAIGAGIVVVLGIAVVAMSGDSKKAETPAAKPASKPKAVDVSGLERDGMKKCDDGLKLIQKHSTLMAAENLSDGQKATLKGDLEQGRKLISDGIALLTQANEKSGNTYNMNQYQEALIIARRKLMTLRD